MRPAAVAAFTLLALACFAANSLLCRLALGRGNIDPARFTAIRVIAGAIALWLLSRLRARAPARRTWRAPLALFAYASAFSFAYASLGAATGALVLFGSVQITMLIAAMRSGERFRALEAAGFAAALAGLVTLVLPGLSAPAPAGCALMALAGISWGVYSLIGRGSLDPLADTARNFSFAMLPSVALLALAPPHGVVAPAGVWLAVVSGAVTSGLGYVLWFQALRGLTAIRAATVQLAVPALAALGGVALLRETVSIRLLIAAALILGGVGLAVASRARTVR